MSDDWAGDGNGAEFGPARKAQTVTQDMITNATEFTKFTKALYVGGDGNIAVKMLDDTVVMFNNVKAGTILPIRIKNVEPNDGLSPATSTSSASTLNLVALS